MGCFCQIWALEQVRDDNQIHVNMKDTDDAIIFRSHNFKKAVGPCCQELRSLNFDKIRFRDTDSKTTLKDNDDVIIASSLDFGKILQFPFRKGYLEEIWAVESAADGFQVWTKLNNIDDVIMLR